MTLPPSAGLTLVMQRSAARDPVLRNRVAPNKIFKPRTLRPQSANRKQCSMILSPAGETSFLLLDKQPALFSAAAQKLYALNDVAALIWCCLEKREPSSMIADRLMEYGVSPTDAATYVYRASRRWLRLGLLQVDVRTFDERVIARSFNVSLGRLTWTFQVTSDHLTHLLLQLFGTYAPPQDSGNILKVIEADGHIYVFHNDTPVLTCLGDDIIPSIKAYLTEQVVTQSAHDIAFHAACVICGTKALLLSGRPGAGKTTLAMHLAQRGFEYCADDVVLIRPDGSMTGVPFAPTIKSGAWGILKKSRPDLEGIAVHRRRDGKRVKYLPVLSMVQNGSVIPVGWIMFIKRRSGGAAKLTPLTRLDALKRLIKSSFLPGGRMSHAALISIKHAIGHADSFELSYSNVKDANEIILTVCNGKS